MSDDHNARMVTKLLAEVEADNSHRYAEKDLGLLQATGMFAIAAAVDRATEQMKRLIMQMEEVNKHLLGIETSIDDQTDTMTAAVKTS